MGETARHFLGSATLFRIEKAKFADAMETQQTMAIWKCPVRTRAQFR
jgi:hypothetical protein